MKKIIAAYIALGLLAWPVLTGMFFGKSANFYEDCSGCGVNFPERRERSVLGTSVAIGFLYAAIWPIGLPAAYCMTGFAEHGIRFSVLPKGQRASP